jgi:beta-phosphoglucomutase-like phosphatase (HAD superfamily)
MRDKTKIEGYIQMTENLVRRFFGPKAVITDFIRLNNTSDQKFKPGLNGVKTILGTKDGKAEFLFFKQNVFAVINSALGYPAYYPLYPAEFERPPEAVLMDLDGTSVRSENFWIWIIQLSIASLLENDKFELVDEDIPFVSGHSVSEHLQYCVKKYCPEKSVEEARKYYFEHTHREMQAVAEGHGRTDAFTPTPGLKEFLLELKDRHIKIGLVTSGLYEKAWPEILSAFRTLDLGDPLKFYDAVITAGFPIRKGSTGTLGELTPKPHPWLYAEVSRVGLGIPFENRSHVLGIEDSGAGVVSIRLAGFSSIGFAGGNIIESGTMGLCTEFFDNFCDIMAYIS